jgi:hypothetical protein
MQPITARLAGPIVWKSRGSFKSEYELRAGDLRVAELVFRGTFRTTITARSGDGCWNFVQRGLFGQRTLIRACESEAVVGEYRSKTWSSTGRLEVGGTQFVYRAGTFDRRSQWTTGSDDASPLVTFKNEGFFRTRTRVEIHGSASQVAALPLLVLFGYYLIAISQRNAAVAAAS